MALDIAQNLVKVTASAQGAGDLTVTLSLADAAKLPAASFNMTWWNATDYADPSDDSNVEIVRVTAVGTATGIITILRAQETGAGGKAASAKNTAGKTYQMICAASAKMFSDIQNNLYKAAQTPGAVTGAIDGINTDFTLPWTPQDPASVILWLNQQPQLQVAHFTLSGTTATYLSPPDASLAGTGHYATGH